MLRMTMDAEPTILVKMPAIITKQLDISALALDYLTLKELLKMQLVCKKWFADSVPKAMIKKWPVYELLSNEPTGASPASIAMYRKLR